MSHMKKIYFSTLGIILSFQTSFADGGVLWDFASQRKTWEKDTVTAIRKWDIHIDDIPNILVGAIDFFLQIAGTVAIIFIIVWAYKILFGSLEQDKTKWKDTVIMALWGFIIASLAWFIVRIILDNFS